MPPNLAATLSPKGRITLPKAMRERLHWEVGTRLVVVQTADGVLLKPLQALFAPTRPEEVCGSISYKGEPKSVEEMDAAIAAAARRR